MVDEVSEVRYTEPESLEEGEARLATLKQRVAEMDAALTAINSERPPKNQPANYSQWVDRRGRRISAKRKVLAEYNFVKQWVHNARLDVIGTVSPHKSMFKLAHQMLAYEDLHRAVGDLLESNDEDEEAWREVENRYKRIKTMYTS